MNYCKMPIVTCNMILYMYVGNCRLNFVTKLLSDHGL